MAFKLNTVVNAYNVDEDMTSEINELNPVRWKVNMHTCNGSCNLGLTSARLTRAGYNYDSTSIGRAFDACSTVYQRLLRSRLT